MWFISYYFHRYCFLNFSSYVPFVPLFLSGLCIDLRFLLLGTLIRLHFPQPILVPSLSSEPLLLLCKKSPHSTKFSAKALIYVATFSTYSLCPILSYKSFHYKLMNDLVIAEESPRKFRNSLTDILGSLHDTEHVIFRTNSMSAYWHDTVPTSWISIVLLIGIVTEHDWGFVLSIHEKTNRNLGKRDGKGAEDAVLAYCRDQREYGTRKGNEQKEAPILNVNNCYLNCHQKDIWYLALKLKAELIKWPTTFWKF